MGFCCEKSNFHSVECIGFLQCFTQLVVKHENPQLREDEQWNLEKFQKDMVALWHADWLQIPFSVLFAPVGIFVVITPFFWYPTCPHWCWFSLSSIFGSKYSPFVIYSPKLFIGDQFMDILCSHGLIDLWRRVSLQSSFSLLMALDGYRCPFVYIKFWLTRWSTISCICLNQETGTLYLVAFFGHPIMRISLSYIWLTFGWIVTTFKTYVFCVQNF